MRLIDANNLLEEMGAGCMPILEKGISQVTGDESTIKDYIDRAPTIDAEPVRHASLKETGMDEAWCPWGDCTNCGESNIMGSTYCNKCGAKLDLEAAYE